MNNELNAYHKDRKTGLILFTGESISQWTANIENPLWRLHDAAHDLLVHFVNGTDLPPTQSLVPVIFAKVVPNSRLLNVIVESSKNLGLNFSSLSKITSRSGVKPDFLAAVIAEIYEYLWMVLDKENNGSRLSVSTNITKNEWEKSTDTRSCKPVIRFVRYIESLKVPGIKSVWVHGSLATLDYISGYSDCDATLILDIKSIIDANSLLRLRKNISRMACRLHKIDPLQHHGLFIVTECDLKSYHQSFFPLKIIERSVALKGEVIINYYDSGSGISSERAAFLSMAQCMRSVACDMSRLRTAYSIKAHVQTLILMWVIYLQLRDGKFWHKKDALLSARDNMPSGLWSIVENITKLRESWKYRSFVPYFHILCIWNPRLPPAIVRAVSKFSSKSIGQKLMKGWQFECLKFSEFLLLDLRRKGKL